MDHERRPRSLTVVPKAGPQQQACQQKAACRLCTASSGEFEAKRTSFFPSIRATLNHILTVDWFYVDALEGGDLGLKAFELDEPFADLPHLTEAQEAVDIRLLSLCENLQADKLADLVRVPRGERIQVDRRDDLLNHLFQHQTHHRGQVHAMLSARRLPHHNSTSSSSRTTQPPEPQK